MLVLGRVPKNEKMSSSTQTPFCCKLEKNAWIAAPADAVGITGSGDSPPPTSQYHDVTSSTKHGTVIRLVEKVTTAK